MPWGEVTPCLDYSFGSIKEEKFTAVWNSEKARNFRKVLKKHKAFPACNRCCGIFSM
jgi:radical SAM protein with 4Fe4S-binding SPASM domain